MNLARLAFCAQLATTLPLVGLIWFVQLVAYPLFAEVDPGQFATYHLAHSTRITPLVAPLMVVELLAAGAWVLDCDGWTSQGVALAGFGLVLATWAVTFFLSVPQHAVLSGGFDAHAHAILVQTNWLRTATWTVRGIGLLVVWWRHG